MHINNSYIQKSPKTNSYQTTSIKELTNKSINKREVENRLKIIFEKNLSKMCKINNK